MDTFVMLVSFVDRLLNRIPLLRRGLLPKRDSFGAPIEQDSLFPFSGIRVSNEKGDPVREEKIDVVPGPIKGEVELSDPRTRSARAGYAVARLQAGAAGVPAQCCGASLCPQAVKLSAGTAGSQARRDWR
jgi:hypothetical protein